MKLLHTLVEGGQTWAHRIRMVKQVLKMALSLSILSMLIYFAYSFSHLDSLILQSGYYHLKADIYSHFSLKGVPVAPKFWENISHEKVHIKEKIVPTHILKKITKKTDVTNSSF